MIDSKTWKSAKDDYVSGTESLAAIAMRFGISKRAVEKRASDEGWAALRLTQNGLPATVPPLTKTPRHSRQPQEINDEKMLDDAIALLSNRLESAEIKSAESAAMAIAKLIEVRRKLVPKTAADLADMAIALGISGAEFVRALNNQCQKKA